MIKINISEEINLVYYYIYKCENINKFEIDFYTYKIYCLAQDNNTLLIKDILLELCNYLKTLILTNKEYNYEIEQIKKSYEKLKNNIDKQLIIKYIKYIKNIK